jgi:large subunit ribosomal protein L11
MGKETLELLVEGGKAAPGPSSAPKLSVLKLNVGKIFKEVNEKTSEYKGMQVPVKIEVDTETKEYKISVGTPPVSSLIKKELGIEKAAVAKTEESTEAPKEKPEIEAEGKEGVGEKPKEEKKVVEDKKEEEAEKERPAEEEPEVEEKPKPKPEDIVIGSLKFDQVVKIAKLKKDELLAKDLKAAIKQVAGTANSMTGILIEGKRPKEIIEEIDEGKWDNKLK